MEQHDVHKLLPLFCAGVLQPSNAANQLLGHQQIWEAVLLAEEIYIECTKAGKLEINQSNA